MTDAIITGPGLYVLRNLERVELDCGPDEEGRVFATAWKGWSDGMSIINGTSHDIIRRATPEEAAKF